MKLSMLSIPAPTSAIPHDIKMRNKEYSNMAVCLLFPPSFQTGLFHAALQLWCSQPGLPGRSEKTLQK